MDGKEEFISVIEETLIHNPEEAAKVLRDPKYVRFLENSSWELVPRLYEHLTEKNRLESPQLYNCTIENLLEIAKFANPEDILFEFIEQTEKQNNVCNFIITLKAIKVVLLRLPQRRGIAIGWCCNAIIRYFSEITIPHPGKHKGNEQTLIEGNSEFQSIQDLYLEVLDFFKPFVKEVENNEFVIPIEHVETYKDTILKALLKLFGHPLVYMNLEFEKKKGTFRNIAENIINLVICFEVDLLSFLDYVDFHNNENSMVEIDHNNLGLGVFYFLVLVENVYYEKVPCVYSSTYLLKQLLLLCMSLMKLDEINAQWKGLSLAEYALSRVSDKCIVFEDVNRYQCKDFAEVCTRIMIYSESKRNREKAVPIFCKFLYKFDPRGRYYMLLSIQDVVKEPGFIGYLATRTKDFIAEALSNRNVEDIKYFTGKCLKDLIKKLCHIEEDCETELIRYADQIIPTLNLIRYLLIRDLEDSTGILELLPTLDKIFLLPLKKAIEISRAHYSLQKNEIHSFKLDSNKIPTSVTVGGKELPFLSAEHKIQIINGALNAFDLIDSLLVRVNECVENRRSSNCVL